MLKTITEKYDALPRQLKRVASYISQQSERIMVDRISDIARECEVHPSAIVRFSQRFGFSGSSEMQALSRQAWAHKTTPVQNYQQRTAPSRHWRNSPTVYCWSMKAVLWHFVR